MGKKLKYIIPGVLFLFIGLFSFSQIWNPTHKNYPPNAYRSDQYDSSPQNWSFAQDKRGILYVGNSSGILEYDGKFWKMVDGTNLSTMDRLCLGNDDRIYAGGTGDFGYLSADSVGNSHLVSLIPLVPENCRDFGFIQDIKASEEGVYFISVNLTFFYDGESLSILEPHRIYKGFEIGGQVYLRPRNSDQNRPIIAAKENTLVPTPWKPALEEDNVFEILGGENSELYFFTYSEGFQLLDKDRFHILNPALKEIYNKSFIFNAAHSGKNHFAIGTIRDGLIVHNDSGQITHHFTSENLLLDNSIYATFQDQESGVWLGTEKGIARIKTTSPIEQAGPENGITGLIRSVTRKGKTLYAGGTDGVFVLPITNFDLPTNSAQKASLIQGLDTDTWKLIQWDDKLVAGNVLGTFQVKPKSTQSLLVLDTRGFVKSKIHPGTVFIGTTKGIYYLTENQSSRNAPPQLAASIESEISLMEEDHKGNLWLSGSNGIDLYWIKNPLDTQTLEIKYFDNESGLPEGYGWIYPYFVNGKIYFGTTIGIYEFDESTETFVPSPDFSDHFTNGKNEARNLSIGPDGTVWMSSLNQFGPLLKNENNQYHWDSTRIASIPPTDIWCIYPDSNGIIYLGTTDGVVRYNTNLISNAPYPALVRKVILGPDSVLFHGTFADSNGISTLQQPEHMIPVLEPPVRNITFEFSAINFDWEDELVFSYYLENYDEEWSAWSYDTKVPYTNLSAGTYTFRVRAKNVYEQISEEGTYTFTINPPLYATWWAFILYGILAIAFIYLIVRMNANRLRKRNIALEATIQDRTHEILEQKDQLEETNEQLRVAKEQAERSEKFMEQFLANMSHEIRTPMNAVMGMTHLLLDTKLDERQQKFLNTIKYASDNLLVIINDILDLTKIEVGQMTLEEIPFRLSKVADGVVNTVLLKAEEKGLKLIVDYDENLPPVIYGDPFRLNQILLNLVNNAVKFTEEGYVRLAMRLLEREDDQVFIRFQVEDSGIGIPEDKLDDIFQSFKQASAETTRKFGGTGLGLTISRHLVELQNGQIDVDSEEDEGTTFGFNLWFQMGTVEELEQEEAAEEAEISGALPPIRLLLVDDDAFNREVGRETLLNWHAGIELEMAENGREALEKVSSKAFDIVLMDMQMPEMDGMTATQAIRKLEGPEANVPIVALTAHASRKERERCLAGGMNEYLTKPFQPKELFRTILRLLPEEARNRPPVPTSAPEDTSPEPTEVLSSGYTLQLLNLEILEGISGGDPKRLMKFLDMFDRLSQQEWKVIRAAAGKKEWDTVRKSAHKLKGQAGYLGVDFLHKLLERIEKFEYPETDLELLTHLLTETEEGLEKVRAEIAEIKIDK